MDSADAAPLVGIAGCLGVIGALLYPYLAVDGGVGTYYGSGLVNPLAAGLLALVTIIVFAAGRQNRTDPALASGASLVAGLVIVVVALAWGMTARIDAVLVSQNHRWVVVAVALLIPAGAVWYARALRLV